MKTTPLAEQRHRIIIDDLYMETPSAGREKLRAWLEEIQDLKKALVSTMPRVNDDDIRPK